MERLMVPDHEVERARRDVAAHKAADIGEKGSALLRGKLIRSPGFYRVYLEKRRG
jgi:hypothetical protein